MGLLITPRQSTGHGCNSSILLGLWLIVVHVALATCIHGLAGLFCVSPRQVLQLFRGLCGFYTRALDDAIS